MDMANMLDSVLNRLYTTFPDIFSLISADSDDLSKSQKNHIFEKKGDFFIEIASKFRDVKTGPIGKRG